MDHAKTIFSCNLRLTIREPELAREVNKVKDSKPCIIYMGISLFLALIATFSTFLLKEDFTFMKINIIAALVLQTSFLSYLLLYSSTPSKIAFGILISDQTVSFVFYSLAIFLEEVQSSSSLALLSLTKILFHSYNADHILLFYSSVTEILLSLYLDVVYNNWLTTITKTVLLPCLSAIIYLNHRNRLTQEARYFLAREQVNDFFKTLSFPYCYINGSELNSSTSFVTLLELDGIPSTREKIQRVLKLLDRKNLFFEESFHFDSKMTDINNSEAEFGKRISFYGMFENFKCNSTLNLGTIKVKKENYTLNCYLNSFNTTILVFLAPEKETVDPFNAVCGVAHDIKNALLAVDTFIDEVFNQDQDDLTRLERYNLIKDMTNYSLFLLNEIKDIELLNKRYSKPLECVEVELKPVLQFCLRIFETKAQILSKTVSFNLEMDQNITVLSNETRLKQIIINLLSNSFKFTETGQIALKVQKQGDEVKIKVCDTGKGMDNKELQEINIPFTKSNLEANSTGWGIGLMIVKKLIGLIGGKTFRVDSTKGEGTCVSFNLTLAGENTLGKSKSTSEEQISFLRKGKQSFFGVDKSFGTIDVVGGFTKTFLSILKGDATARYNGGFYLPKSVLRDISTIEEEDVSLDELTKVDWERAKKTDKQRIMLVDDNQIFVKGAKKKLNDHFMGEVEVVTAFDGSEALYFLFAMDFGFSLIISDKNMNFIGGAELYRLISQCPRSRGINFLLSSDDALEGVESIEKPISNKGIRRIEELLA